MDFCNKAWEEREITEVEDGFVCTWVRVVRERERERDFGLVESYNNQAN